MCHRCEPPERCPRAHTSMSHHKWHLLHLRSQDKGATFFCSYLEKFVVTLWRHQEASILKLHLPIFQQVVQNGQNVPLCLFQAFQNKGSAFCGCTDCTLFPRDKSNMRIWKMPERGLILLVMQVREEVRDKRLMQPQMISTFTV